MNITKVDQIYHGMPVRCKIDGEVIEDAKISINSLQDIFICQNKLDGWNNMWVNNMFEYKYSWDITPLGKSKYLDDNEFEWIESKEEYQNKESKLIYLAIPYTWNPEESFKIANKVAAKLIKEGNIVFSPISHSHVVADYMKDEDRLDQKLWQGQYLPILERFDELFVIVIGEDGHKLISESKGCLAEIKKAKDMYKPVKYINYEY